MKKKIKKPIITKAQAKKGVVDSGNFIADNKKSLLYLSGAIVLGVVGYKIYKGFSSGVSNVIEDVFAEKSEKVTIDTVIDKGNVTITKEQSQQFAQSLLDACNEMFPFYGTDEEAIKRVFLKLRSGDDYKMVFDAFGMKNYNGYNSPPTGWGRHIDNYAPKDLNYWLRSELSESDGEVYNIVKSRIESAGHSF